MDLLWVHVFHAVTVKLYVVSRWHQQQCAFLQDEGQCVSPLRHLVVVQVQAHAWKPYPSTTIASTNISIENRLGHHAHWNQARHKNLNLKQCLSLRWKSHTKITQWKHRTSQKDTTRLSTDNIGHAEEESSVIDGIQLQFAVTIYCGAYQVSQARVAQSWAQENMFHDAFACDKVRICMVRVLLRNVQAVQVRSDIKPSPDCILRLQAPIQRAQWHEGARPQLYRSYHHQVPGEEAHQECARRWRCTMSYCAT